MAQGTLKHLPSELEHTPSSSASALGNDGADLELATSVANVRLRTSKELGIDSWQSSVQSSFKGSPENMECFVDLHRSDPEACHRLAEAVTALPEVGTELLGFRLHAELGRGAFGRVFLAQQGDLANRPVVLKVSPRIDDEPQTLAQLQHTNIVPVYSVHRAGPLQAVCMPYFGATTLAKVVKELEDRKSLPESGKELISTIVAHKGTVRDGDITSGTGARRPTSGGMCEASRAGSAGSCLTPASGAQPADAGPPPTLELLQRFSYVEAVLWIGSSLADGLAHAHERGIIHRDLKPANILLTDDGQPMLLDFNLARDTKLGSHAGAAQAGGTLPFMAPEQIEAFRAERMLLDHRSDIYSLGVILYQLLTGRRPFPSHGGPVKQVMERMVQDRLQTPPAVRCWSKAVSPAVESIIRHCLEPKVEERYQSARELKEDLDRQLQNLPLRHAPEPSLRERAGKWRRRHPRLASMTTVIVFLSVVVVAQLIAVVIRDQRLAEMDARQTLSAFLDSKKSVQYLLTARTDDAAQVDQGIQLGRDVLAQYGGLDNAWPNEASLRHLSAEDQAVLRKNGAELLVLLARGVALQAANLSDRSARQDLVTEALRLNKLADGCGNDGQSSRALLAQRADLTSLLGHGDEADKLRSAAQATPLRTAADRYLVAAEHTAKGRYNEALPLLSEVTDEEPQDFWAWFQRGVCHDHLSQSTEALACYSTCIALAPQSPWAHLNRGLTYLRLQNYKQAEADLDQVIALRPKLVEAYKSRAIALQGLQKYAQAVADLDRALELGAAPTHVYFLRAAVRERAGDREGAKQDRAEGMRQPPTDEMGWLTRGYARMNADARAALEDFDQALRLNGRSLAALQNKAHILSKLGRNEEAARTLDRALEAFPDFIPARAGRGTMLARLGQREAAHKDAVDCLARDNKAMTIYQLAGLYALTSKTNPDDRQQAFRLLSASLQKGVGFDLLETDRDLDPIRACPDFQRLVEAARAIRATTTASHQ